ncbi:uncharacterized protein LOC111715234 isoform X2 [Eurytemora carolleeae]|uniref:uncharacterized protein LOC111715234 isoform X2 n=1 Tax=Eurytemora carolleeae TaxID=1294199 RepID=UPI000C780473|nr:uncharacterized protein LOC111715234 isoform X2 [Eurytemora carolleeae]|eukprot:XP_023346309.1 uncharacterized protein LOC111715234 isoform X2 [Eurytemora affinis]
MDEENEVVNRNYNIGNGTFLIIKEVRYLQFDIWFDNKIFVSHPNNRGLTKILLPYYLISRPTNDALTFINNRTPKEFVISSETSGRKTIGSILNSNLQELANNITASFSTGIIDHSTVIEVHHACYYKVGEHSVFLSENGCYLLEPLGIRKLTSDEVQNLLETKVYLVFKNPKVAEGVKYCESASEAFECLDKVMKIGVDIFPGGVFQNFFYYMIDGCNRAHPDVKEFFTLGLQSRQTGTGKGVLLKLMKIFMTDEYEDSSLDLGFTLSSLSSALQNEPVCFDELTGNRDVITSAILSNWTGKICLRSTKSSNLKVFFPVSFSTNMDREEVMKKLRTDTYMMDKVLFMNVGESQLENERKIDDLMLGIRELRKCKPYLLGYALKSRELSNSLQDEKIESLRILKQVGRMRSFYNMLEQDMGFQTNWCASPSYNCVLVPGLNLPYETMTVEGMVKALVDLPDEEFIKLRPYVNKGPRKNESCALNLRFVEAEVRKFALFNTYREPFNALPTLRTSNISAYARRNNKVLRIEDEYKKYFNKLYLRVLNTAGKVEFGRKEGQVWQDGDPTEDDITEDEDFIAENLFDEPRIHSDYTEEHRNNEDEIDDSREDKNTQNISVLSTGGDDQTENQTTSNKIPVEFGRKESQVWEDGDPSEDDITEDKDFTAENLIDEAYIDDSREDENTQKIQVQGDDLKKNETTSQKIQVQGDDLKKNQTTSQKNQVQGDDLEKNQTTAQKNQVQGDDLKKSQTTSQNIQVHGDNRMKNQTTSQKIQVHGDNQMENQTTSQKIQDQGDDRMENQTTSQKIQVQEDNRMKNKTTSQKIQVHGHDRMKNQTTSKKIQVQKDDGIKNQTTSKKIQVQKDDRMENQTTSKKIQVQKDDRMENQTTSQKIQVQEDDRMENHTTSQKIQVQADDRIENQTSSQKMQVEEDDLKKNNQTSSQKIQVQGDNRMNNETTSQKIQVQKDDRMENQTTSQKIQVQEDDRMENQTTSQKMQVQEDDRMKNNQTNSQKIQVQEDNRMNNQSTSQKIQVHGDNQMNNQTTSQKIQVHGDNQMENQTTSQKIQVQGDDRMENQTTLQKIQVQEDNRMKNKTTSQKIQVHGDDRMKNQTTAEKISVLSTGGDDQAENQTTSNKLKRNRAKDYDLGKSDTSPASDNDDCFIEKKKKYSKKIPQNKPKVKI